MKERPVNRFYKQATDKIMAGRHGVCLDGHILKTPAKTNMILPTRRLAQAIAAEWNAQGETLYPKDMPLTRLAGTAIDQTPLERRSIADTLTRYGQTDTLCHLADQPVALRQYQQTTWKPWRDWADKTMDIRLKPVTGLIPGEQPATSLERIHMQAYTLDDFHLTGLAAACALFGSVILAFAVGRRALSAQDALRISMIDEDWQSRYWGTDNEATVHRASREREADALEEWFATITAK